jgi:hypothetical protein
MSGEDRALRDAGVERWLPVVDAIVAARGGDGPAGFDRKALVRDLRRIEFEFRYVRLPQEQRLTDLDAEKQMRRLSGAAKRLRETLKKLGKHEANRRHLIEETISWAVHQPRDAENPIIC